MISVFTPAYNRAYCIDKLYRSLQRQTYRDFEWVVVDDGSTDNTSELFAVYQNDENDFNIKYEKTANGGKHRAINKGLKMASGELFFIVDSDDYLTDDALMNISDIVSGIPESEKKEFCGVCGMRGTSDGGNIGSSFAGDTLDITYLEAAKNGITGDKAEVFFTKTLLKYPFPEFDGEKFILESVVWDRMAADGLKLRYFNKCVYICEYLQDGLTMNMSSVLKKAPKGYGLYLQQCIRYGKIKKMNKWNKLYDYYNQLKGQIGAAEIARNLSFDPVVFYLRMQGMRIFYKLYQ